MKSDYQSYKRATSVSLLGLVLQLTMGLTLLIYSFWARPMDVLALTGSLSILLGAIVWLLLAILFDQHRRERIEQMELEAMNATGVREASAFSGGTDDLRVAHKRLVWMHKFLVPAVSLLYAAALGALGVFLFVKAREFLWPSAKALKAGVENARPDFISSSTFGLVISITLAIAFIGFVFARYVAGMAKQPVWAHLRAGAGAAVGAAIFAALTAIAQLVDKFGPSEPVQYLHIIWPVVMIVLAVEVVLSFLFGMYSPRKPGEFPRPPLDSKILSFAAAPDRIAASIGEALNYQFGFDVTGNWFYQLLTRSATVLVLLGVVVVWLLSCVAIVQPNEQGLRVRLGEKLGGALPPGPYLKLPWPLERIETFRTTVARRLNLGVDEPNLKGAKSILWTNDHGVAETYFVVRSAVDSRPADDEDAQKIAGVAVAIVEIPVFYVVEDYAAYDAFGPEDQRDERLTSEGRRVAFKVLATQTIDEVLGTGREQITNLLRDSITKRFAEMNAGVKVLFVGIEGVHPPRETAAAFEEIVRAQQMQKGALSVAQKDANASLIRVAGSVDAAKQITAAIDQLSAIPDPAAHAAKQHQIEELLAKAGGTAASTIQQARADRWNVHLTRRAAAEELIGQLAGYQAAPDVYIARRYFDTLTAALKDARVYIVADDGHTHAIINLEDAAAGGDIFLKPKDKE